jgi:hypothetical protein
MYLARKVNVPSQEVNVPSQEDNVPSQESECTSLSWLGTLTFMAWYTHFPGLVHSPPWLGTFTFLWLGTLTFLPWYTH